MSVRLGSQINTDSVQTAEQDHIKDIKNALDRFVFGYLSDDEKKQLLELVDSISHDEYEKVFSDRIDDSSPMKMIPQLTNVRKTLSKNFKYPFVKLSFIVYLLRYPFVYPEELINYVIEHEDEYYTDCKTFLRFSDKSTRLMLPMTYDSPIRTLRHFVIGNLIMTWLFNKDLSITFEEAIEKGLNLDKIDDSSIDETDDDSSMTYSNIAFYGEGLVMTLTTSVEKFYKHSVLSEKLPNSNSNEVGDPSEMRAEDIMNVLRSKEFKSSFETLFNLTAFEFFAFSSFYNEFHGEDSIPLLSAAALLQLCSNNDRNNNYQNIVSMFPCTPENNNEINRIDEMIAPLNKMVPETLSNPVAAYLSRYVSLCVLREREFSITTRDSYFWMVFFSSPFIELFGSERTKSALRKLEDYGEDPRSDEQILFGLNFDKLDLLIKWNEQDDVDDWSIPFSLFYNLHLDVNSGVSSHIKNCAKSNLFPYELYA